MSYIAYSKKALSEEKRTLQKVAGVSAKDTNELEHELAAAKSVEAYFKMAYALDHRMSVVDANLLLDSLGQEPLLE